MNECKPLLNTPLLVVGRKGGGGSCRRGGGGMSARGNIPPANVCIARRVVARWRALVAERKASPLLDLLEAVPDRFLEEVKAAGRTPSTAPCSRR